LRNPAAHGSSVARALRPMPRGADNEVQCDGGVLLVFDGMATRALTVAGRRRPFPRRVPRRAPQL
jgi:hypothetical protein